MQNGVISIIVPVYNVEFFLEECVQSILGQTYTNLEVILVNDGSTDKSGELCNDFAAKDNRIKVVHKENGGLSCARNAGLEIATGEYVGFVDADDWIESDMYERMYAKIAENGADICICGFKLLYDGYERVMRVPHEDSISTEQAWERLLTDFRSYYATFVSMATKLISRDIIENGKPVGGIKPPLRFIKGIINEDGWFLADCINMAENGIVFEDFAPYNYRKTDNPHSLSRDEDSYMYKCKMLKYWKERLQLVFPSRIGDIENVIKCQTSVALVHTMQSIILSKQKTTLSLSRRDVSTILRYSNSKVEKVSILLMYYLPTPFYRLAYRLYSMKK